MEGGFAQGSGDVTWADGRPIPCSMVVVLVEAGGAWGAMHEEVVCDVAKAFGGAEPFVRRGSLGDLLSFDCVLLVSVCKGRRRDGGDCGHVMQRGSVGGKDLSSVDEEVDVVPLEGLSAGFWCVGEGVLGRPTEPIPGQGDEVDAVSVEGPVLRVVHVEGIPEGFKDSDVNWVGPFWGIVHVAEAFEEGPDERMVTFPVKRVFARVGVTQCGDPLSDGQ